MLRRSHDAGLTEDDLKRMSFDEFFAWLELHDWMYSPSDDDEEQPSMSAQEGKNKFFHM
jgi:hypothetical protein